MKPLLKSTALETLTVNKHIKSAIIGYWRMGANTDEIMPIVNLRFMIVQKIILDYQNKNHEIK